MKTKINTIIEHANKEVLDKVQIELYILIIKLLDEEINQISQTSFE